MTAQNIPSAHPKVEIDMADFGREGKIVMSQPNFRRMTALQNTVIRLIYVNEKANVATMDSEERMQALEEAITKYESTVQTYSVLSYIESAPFHLNDYRTEVTLDVDSFYDYMDMPLYKRLFEAVDELGVIDPLS